MFSNSISGLTPTDVLALNGNNGAFGNGDSWLWLIAILAIFGGFGGNGGLFGGNRGGVNDGYVLTSDFASLERKADGLANGICDASYATLGNFNTTNMAIAQNGYESRLATQTLGSQLASCCCEIREGIAGVNTQSVMNTNAIQNQIAQCCCENEKLALQNKYDAATANCETLKAIDKVGDRIIDYLATEKTQALRDENASLKLFASQQAQNTSLINALRPTPVPAYTVANPYCGCSNIGYNGVFGYGVGTTIA